jgi:beta-glucosidase
MNRNQESHSASDQSGQIQQFPKGFFWGAATSSHQVEGNNYWNDWWEYEQSGRVPHKSGEACRHYQLFEKDFDMARSWGHNVHRFSIEWSRIEPSRGNWNDDAVLHYRRVIQTLKERGLEPVVTLHHFTNPAWFTRSGGWLLRDSARLFSRYTEFVIENLGSDVKYWLTINEPTVYVLEGYINGAWPPCFKSAWWKAAVALRNLARAHVAAYRTLHAGRKDNMVGLAHSAPLIMACDPSRWRDRNSALLRDVVLNRLFFHLIRTVGKGLRMTANLDFLGVNYYTRTFVRSSGLGLKAVLGKACRAAHHSDLGPSSSINWEIYPPGLRSILKKFSTHGLPLLITENGVATEDEALRQRFIAEHLKALAQAINEGVNVIGYLYWSLLDNFEWAIGTDARFGLAAVDFNTQERVPRPCTEYFRRVCLGNRM